MAGFFDKLRQGLSKTGSGIAAIFTGSGIDDEFYEELEEALIMADVGMATTDKLLSGLRDAVAEKKIKERSEARKELISLLADLMRPEKPFLDGADRAVIMVVGVNGVGKTTSLGKIAAYYKNQGRDVVLAAADTFRAAAAEQLTVWAERAGVPIIKHGEGADPAAVVFDAAASFKARNRDMLLCDTAGRLHNKKNLMDELAKIDRVLARELPGADRETLLVLDATTGQNAVIQAKAFKEAAKLTGLILTKMDGTAKGGIVFSIRRELGIPVKFIGVGEQAEDLQPFSAQDFVKALFEGEHAAAKEEGETE